MFIQEVTQLAQSLMNDIQVFGALMIVDVVTGLIRGTKNHRLSSAIMNLGIRKKSGMMFSIVTAIILDAFMFNNVPTFSTMMVMLSIANEGLSITENLAQLGFPMPKIITKRLQALKDANEEK